MANQVKALEIKGLTVFYDDNRVLSDVNLEVETGEYLGIIGPNGGGKTTLLKAVLGLVPKVSGTIKVFGDGSRKRIGYVPQFADLDRKFPINAAETVMSGMLGGKFSLFHKYTSSERNRAVELLDNVGLKRLSERQIGQLSGGELQRVLIARALALEPEMLLLDEPAANIDAGSRDMIYRLFADLNRTMTIILVTHDLFAISSKVTRIACLNVNLIYHGKPELDEKTVNTLYGCPVDLIAHGVPHRVLKKHSEVER
ncbi:MAG: ABC transporter ATP-binding protein [Eubacteriales bacterium]|nr:ABC transporter ATP-binding protein [Eubacteriales bacterium]